jgi:hypothetical protein
MDRLLSGFKPHRPELKPPDCVARYVVVKHSWRGKYRRIVCITPSALYTQNPEGRLVVTNSYVFAAVGPQRPGKGGRGVARASARASPSWQPRTAAPCALRSGG